MASDGSKPAALKKKLRAKTRSSQAEQAVTQAIQQTGRKLKPRGETAAALASKARLAAPGLSRHRRDSAATRQRILEAGRQEYAEHGFSGARIDRIARAAQSNVQMIYRYFGSKEELYLAVLEDTYARVRNRERELRLGSYEPAEGFRRLVEFTFDFLIEDAAFVAIIRSENVAGGRFIQMSDRVPVSTLPLLAEIIDLLKRGRASGRFKREVEPTQIYVTILALCFTHLSNRHTLSAMFQHDVSDPEWLAARREHAVQVVLSYLTTEL